MGYEQALKAYIAATNTHDFRHVRLLLADHAVYWFSDRTCRSIAEIQDYFEHAWKTIKDEVYRATDIEWIVAEENTATCIYTYQYEGYANEKFVQGSGRATNVFIKDSNGKWKLVHEHLSSIS